MKKMKRLLVALIALLPMTTMAQKSVEASVQADVLSRYYWRGIQRGGITIQPSFRLGWQGLFFEGMGSVGFDKDDNEEVNLTLGYELAGFNIGVTDYWSTGIDAENRYFYYDPEKGAHQFEGNLGYTCKYFSLQAYCVFYGNDYKINGKRAYSTYIEAEVPFRLGGIDWALRGGMTPFESAGEMVPATSAVSIGGMQVVMPEYYYAEKTACTVAALRGTKDIQIGNVHLPIFAELHTNPYLQKAALVFGFSVIPF